MVRVTHTKHKESIINPKYSNPHPDLIDWFQKRLTLEHERKEFAEKGQKPTKSFHSKIKSSGARKAEFLDEIIFPSMANLIYFLEALEISPTLKKLFEKDLIKLLDPRFVKYEAKGMEMGMNMSSYVFRWNNLARLVSKAVSLNYTTDKEEKSVKNFRIALIYQLQTIIRDEVKYIFEKQFGYMSQVTKSAMKDFGNTIGWLALAAKSISEEFEKEPDRAIGFAPITYSNRSGLSGMTF